MQLTIVVGLGAHKAGLIVVPCGPMFRSWELEEELTQTGTKIIVCHDDLYINVKEADRKCRFHQIIVTGFGDYLPLAPAFPVHQSMNVPRVYHPDTSEFLDILTKGNPEYVSPEVGMDDVCLIQFTSLDSHGVQLS